MYKSGDKVLFNWIDKETDGNTSGLKIYIGIILSSSQDGTYMVLQYTDGKFYKRNSIKEDNIYDISKREDAISEIKNRYEKLLSDKKEQLKTVEKEEKDSEKLEIYRDVKKRILVNAERMLNNSLDEDDFLNRLKEIESLKKQMFSTKIECVGEIRRHNGKIKYEYRQLEYEMKELIKGVSEEMIKKAFE